MILPIINCHERNEEVIKEFYDSYKDNYVFFRSNGGMVKRDMRRVKSFRQLRDMLYNFYTKM